MGKNRTHPEVLAYESILKEDSSLKLKNVLSQTAKAYQKKRQPPYKSWLLYASIASVAILIGITFLSPKKTSPDELYSTYAQFSELPSLVHRGENDQALLIKTQQLFEKKEYAEALELLESEVDQLDQNQATYYLYKGISQMELNQYAGAEQTFDTLSKTNLIDAPKGVWYKVLLYLKMEEFTKAKKALLLIINSGESYKKKEAGEILKVLEGSELIN